MLIFGHKIRCHNRLRAWHHRGYVCTRALHKEAAPPRSLICRQPILKILLLFSLVNITASSLPVFSFINTAHAHLLADVQLSGKDFGAVRGPSLGTSTGSSLCRDRLFMEDSTYYYFGSKCWQSGACNRHDVAGCASSTNVLHKRFITPF